MKDVFRAGRDAVLRVFVIVPLTIAASQANAACAVCTPGVRFDEALAKCFEAAADDELAKLKAGKKFVMINLDGCAKASGSRGDDVLPQPTAQSLDAAFVTDEAGLLCLKAQLAAATRPLNPSADFELKESCP